MTVSSWVKCTFLACALLAAIPPTLSAAEPDKSPQQWLDEFSNNWNEENWTQRGRYMRSPDDRGWRFRMRALKGLVGTGKAAVPLLQETLASGKSHERIFAAQTLSYLAPHALREKLLEAARNDKDAAVRLYAIDALGMQGKANLNFDWNPLKKAESNRDARSHIGYAIERKTEPVATAVIDTLKRWDFKAIDSAVVGKMAPDFELKSANGKKIRLSQFRGKKAVVLVFVYGDT